MTKMTFKRYLCFILALLMTVALMAGCGKKEEPEDTEPVTETEPTEPPKPVTTGNHDSKSLACKDTYTEDANDDAVVATAGEAKLTNRQLRIYYAAQIAAFQNEDHGEKPDFNENLDAQLCPLEQGNVSWQHYFLQRALNSWNVQQALWNQAQQEQPIVEKYYKAEPTTHAQFFPDTLPAYPLAYITRDHYTPNELHQAYLDAMPDKVEEAAAANGYADGNAMAKAVAGEKASADDLAEFGKFYNFAYMYFTERSYGMEVTAEELQSYLAEHPGEYGEDEKTVTIRHALMIPEGATVAADGTVTASEEAWEACSKKLEELNTARKKNWINGRNPENTFAVLANENSADMGSQLNGGRYVNISKGQMQKDIDAWCFAPERQKGDETSIRTSMGLEVLHYVSGETLGEAKAKADALMEKYRSMLNEFQTAYPMSVDFSKVCLSGDKAMDGEALLYPDVAHEQYPVIPLYLQQDYAPAPFGAYHVHNHGCGITTFAMVASYMADKTLTPGFLATEYSMFAVPHGTNGDIFDLISPELGFFCERRSWEWQDVEDTLNSGRIAVSLQYHGHFTKTGHYLALQRMTEDGKVVIRDSNIYNYARLKGHQVDCFDPSLVIANNAVYWLFQPKITRIPACARCGDPGNTEMPNGLFNSDYTCEKCQTALSRRNDFLALSA